MGSDNLDFVGLEQQKFNQKKNKRIQKTIEKKLKENKCFHVCLYTNFKESGEIERAQVDDDENENYDFHRAEEMTDEQWEKFCAPYNKMWKELQEKVDEIFKKKKFKKLPYSYEDLDDDKKSEKMDDWERDLFEKLEALGYVTLSEHHGHGEYLVCWALCP